MTQDETFEDERATDGGIGDDPSAEPEFRVEDRRHWQRATDREEGAAAEPAPERIGVLDEYRLKAEEAERKLLEYIEAFKRHKADQDRLRGRLTRDVERRVELAFGQLVAEFLEVVDHLDLALSHAQGAPEAEPLARGVRIARDHFLAALSRHGVERLCPAGTPFDPNQSEALRVDPVDSPEAHDLVTETLKPGYRLGERIVRPAQVAVGRYRPQT